MSIVVSSDLEGTQFMVHGMRLPMNRDATVQLCKQLLDSLARSHEYRKNRFMGGTYDNSARPVELVSDGNSRFHLVA